MKLVNKSVIFPAVLTALFCSMAQNVGANSINPRSDRILSPSLDNSINPRADRTYPLTVESDRIIVLPETSHSEVGSSVGRPQVEKPREKTDHQGPEVATVPGLPRDDLSSKAEVLVVPRTIPLAGTSSQSETDAPSEKLSGIPSGGNVATKPGNNPAPEALLPTAPEISSNQPNAVATAPANRTPPQVPVIPAPPAVIDLNTLPEMLSRVTPQEKGEEMEIPENGDISFLRGDWSCKMGALRSSETNEPVKIRFNFNDKGAGSISVVEESGAFYKGSVKAILKNRERIIESTRITNSTGTGGYVAQYFECTQAPDALKAICRGTALSEKKNGSSELKWSGVQFFRE